MTMIKNALLFVFLMFGIGYLYGAYTKQPPVEVVPIQDHTLDFITPNYDPTDEAEVEQHPIEQLTIINTDKRIEYEPIDKFCLAKNIYHEARGEDLLGQLAVAQVTINRLKSPRYPSTICNVVMQRFQFSWANNASRRWTHPRGEAWEHSKLLAEQFLKHGVRVSGLETALFYHADWVDPNWRDPDSMIVQIGTHIFYERARQL